ncbi:outer membrane protein assembly factor BamA [Rhodothermus bifroesti]|nr:outer membrane protein assembly factor BamA [Rhodothermus bifroesti]GBD01678.1 Outer membrane protein assembly factor BamA [bacterium HR18]
MNLPGSMQPQRMWPYGLSMLLWLLAAAAHAQTWSAAPRQLTLQGIRVEGLSRETTKDLVLQASGLRIGQELTLPGDPALASAIRGIYQLGLFSQVQIVEDRREGQSVYLTIRVQEEPRLADYTFSGLKKGDQKELRKKLPLFRGARVRPADVERSEQIIRDYLKEKGYLLASVATRREVNQEGEVVLHFDVDRGEKVKIGKILFEGNQEVSDGKLRGRMKHTKQKSWWRFWRKARFDAQKFEEDLQRIIDYYNEKGFYDARIVRDTVYLAENTEDPELVVQVTVHEGPRYYIRRIEWEGNTVYPDHVLTEALGLRPGDPFNRKKLEENLYGNKRSSDVTSLHMNRGYMLFRVEPRFQVVGDDSLDLYFDIYEGDIFEFGTISIAGNTKTKEHVIRRELYTIPGETFSRDAIQESIRRLAQLNYFNQEALAAGPEVQINPEKKTVDLTYKVEEVGSDQLELSGTWGQLGLILMLRFTMNNFSAQNIFNGKAWRPLPSGDGQQLSLSIQTNGTYYQSYGISFTEPWFRGRPTPVGFAVDYTRFSDYPYYSNIGDLTTFTSRVFYERRLKWPDDYFSGSLGLGFQYFKNDNFTFTLPLGVSREVTLRAGLTRNALDNPLFPTSGSLVRLSLDVALPIANYVQYHKWGLKTSWNIPLARKVSLAFGTDFGYIGSITGAPVAFQRFIVGGSPFDTQGAFGYYGKDIVYMRGYPLGVLGPRLNDEPVGGRILNKYTSELRWLAVQTPQLQAAPYLFMDAANTWDRWATYNPAQLFRSAGFGVRLFLPILGMIELTYGYNFDEFQPISSQNHDGSRRWYFQFSLGQGFNQ